MIIYTQIQPPNPEDRDLYFQGEKLIKSDEEKRRILSKMLNVKNKGVFETYKGIELYWLFEKKLLKVPLVTKDLKGRKLYLLILIQDYIETKKDILNNTIEYICSDLNLEIKRDDLLGMYFLLNELKKKMQLLQLMTLLILLSLLIGLMIFY